MAISSTTRSASFTGNGSTTAYPTGFKFLSSADLTVAVGGATKTLGTDYTVTGAGSDSGGTVTFTTAPANGVAVSIVRDTPRLQPVDFRTQGFFYPSVHDTSFDREMMALQDVEAEHGTRLSSLESSRTTDEANISSLTTRTANLETHDTSQDATVSHIDARVTALEAGSSPPAPITASYTGVASALSSKNRPSISVTEPASGSSLTADILSAPDKALADKLASIIQAAMFRTMDDFDASGPVVLSTIQQNGCKARLYVDSAHGFFVTSNASWNGTQWVADDTTVSASRLVLAVRNGQPGMPEMKSTTTTAWNDNGWDYNGGGYTRGTYTGVGDQGDYVVRYPNGLVSLKISLSIGNTIAHGSTLATIDAGFRPTTYQKISAYRYVAGGTYQVVPVVIDAAGVLECAVDLASGDYIYVSATYPWTLP